MPNAMPTFPMRSPLLLADLSSPETRELIETIELVLIPLGAHEQHGPNIAVSTDTISADALCRAAAALTGPRVAVAPAIPWGISWHHMRFPGTIKARFLPPIPAGLPREEFRERLIRETEAACDAFLIEIATGPNPPPMPPTAQRRLRELGVAVPAQP